MSLLVSLGRAFVTTTSGSISSIRSFMLATTTSRLDMVRNRGGLEVNREGATPQPGGMELYLKAGPDKTSPGDCPFAHYVRLVLEEKGLEYDLKPAVAETKPQWLIEHYDGKMPALRHRKECYVESDVIASYLEFFFPKPSLSCDDKEKVQAAEAAVEGLFPKIAKYIKHTPDGDDEDNELRNNLLEGLETLNQHLKSVNDGNTEYSLTGTGMTLLDCALVPKLYHMKTACNEYKNGIAIPEAVQTYMDQMFARASFQKTVYPEEYVNWGWGNARS